jgi:hypothetical protein
VSTEAIEKVVSELKALPEADQELFLSFVRDLKRQRTGVKSVPLKRSGKNPALKRVDGMLVFTGQILDQETDWLRVVRDEREDEIFHQATGGKPGA